MHKVLTRNVTRAIRDGRKVIKRKDYKTQNEYFDAQDKAWEYESEIVGTEEYKSPIMLGYLYEKSNRRIGFVKWHLLMHYRDLAVAGGTEESEAKQWAMRRYFARAGSSGSKVDSETPKGNKHKVWLKWDPEVFDHIQQQGPLPLKIVHDKYKDSRKISGIAVGYGGAHSASTNDDYMFEALKSSWYTQPDGKNFGIALREANKDNPEIIAWQEREVCHTRHIAEYNSYYYAYKGWSGREKQLKKYNELLKRGKKCGAYQCQRHI